MVNKQQSILDNISIVLVGTSCSGNIGAAARAMKNMGLGSLRLVAPRCEVNTGEARARAKGAIDVLQQGAIFGDLAVALADYNVVFATSSRTCALPWPKFTVKEAAQFIAEDLPDSKIAIVFGPENTGLLSTDLQQCNYQIQIPASEQYAVLNLAQAVQIICYELFSTLADLPQASKKTLLALTKNWKTFISTCSKHWLLLIF